MHTKEKMKKKGGFTLLELLIVVALLAALVGLMLPQFRDRSAQATETIQSSNMAQLDRTLRQFRNVNGVWPTLWNTGTHSTMSGTTNTYTLIPSSLSSRLVDAGVMASGTLALDASHTLTAAFSTNLTAAGKHVFVHGEPRGFRSANDLVVTGMGPPALAADFQFPESASAILLAAGTDLTRADGTTVTFQGRSLAEICTAANGYRALLLPVTDDIYWTMKANGSIANMGGAVMTRAMAWGGGSDILLEGAPQNVLPIYLRAIDHVFGQDNGWKRLRSLLKELSAAFALAVPRPETDAITPHLAFFQRVAAMIRKRLADDSGMRSTRQIDIDAAVRQVVGGAVDADEVIDLFAVAGLEEARLDILSDEFLGRVAALEQKNLALETLRKLLNDQIRITERTNIVQSRKFREALEDAMLRYTNKAITTAEMITRLIDLAKTLRDAQKHGEELGLTSEETAFYDALAENGSAREIMQIDTLRLMARELTEMVRRMPKLDWTQRESVRASLRRNVRRLLAKFGYPPDLAEDATQLVLRQAELSTENAE